MIAYPVVPPSDKPIAHTSIPTRYGPKPAAGPLIAIFFDEMAIAPTIQMIGLSFLYLAGGVVVVEYIFNYPGLGQALVSAVSDRDIPVIQFIVVVLAAFYMVVNIATDMIALLATPRRRIAR